MKKTVASFLFFIPLLVFCNHSNNFTIRGAIAGLDTGTIELVYHNNSGDDTTVTANVIAGKFTLTGQVPEPELARFNIRTGWPYSSSFFLENADITFSLVKDNDDKTQITGSASNLIYQELEPQLNTFFANARNYDNVRQQALNSHNSQAAINADSVWATQLQEWTRTIRKAVTAQPQNYAALYFIQWLFFHPPNYDTIMSLFMRLDPIVRNGLAGKSFTEQFNQYKRISTGQPAPEISGNDTSGHPQRLASLKGQFVLLDFWASYCGICRQTNPKLKAVYDRYHTKGFEVFSVSLDYQRASWVKAIEDDKLNWPQVSELRGGAAASAALYNVQDLPRNWLIDRKGNIIAHDLSITDLTQTLNGLLKK